MMTDEQADDLGEAEAALARLGVRRRELNERRTALQREIEGFSRGLDQADQDLRIRAIMRGDYGAAERRSLNRALDEANENEEQLRLVQMAIDRQKQEVAAARRREARRIAAELAPQYDAAAARIATALEELQDAQAAERAVHAQIGAEQPILPELGRPLPGLDHLLARAREHLAARRAAA
jgi:chromosome segregation ATPase